MTWSNLPSYLSLCSDPESKCGSMNSATCALKAALLWVPLILFSISYDFPVAHKLHPVFCGPSCSQGFDEYMNLVLDEAEEVNVKTKNRKSLGKFLCNLQICIFSIFFMLSFVWFCLFRAYSHERRQHHIDSASPNSLTFSSFLCANSACVHHLTCPVSCVKDWCFVEYNVIKHFLGLCFIVSLHFFFSSLSDVEISGQKLSFSVIHNVWDLVIPTVAGPLHYDMHCSETNLQQV